MPGDFGPLALGTGLGPVIDIFVNTWPNKSRCYEMSCCTDSWVRQ